MPDVRGSLHTAAPTAEVHVSEAQSHWQEFTHRIYSIFPFFLKKPYFVALQYRKFLYTATNFKELCRT